MHVSISKIIRRSKRLSPVKLASSPAKVDKQIPTTSQAIVDEAVDTIHDISYDSDAELNLTATAHGMCTSCDRLRKIIKALQKTLSWYKMTKAIFQKKLRPLEYQTLDSDTRATCVTMAELEEYSDDDSLDTDSDGTASMDYSSFEESSHSEIDEDITRNTVRLV